MSALDVHGASTTRGSFPLAEGYFDNSSRERTGAEETIPRLGIDHSRGERTFTVPQRPCPNPPRSRVSVFHSDFDDRCRTTVALAKPRIPCRRIVDGTKENILAHTER